MTAIFNYIVWLHGKLQLNPATSINRAKKNLDKSELIGTFLAQLPKGYFCLSNNWPISCTSKSL